MNLHTTRQIILSSGTGNGSEVGVVEGDYNIPSKPHECDCLVSLRQDSHPRNIVENKKTKLKDSHKREEKVIDPTDVLQTTRLTQKCGRSEDPPRVVLVKSFKSA